MKFSSPTAVVVNDDRIQLQILTGLAKKAGVEPKGYSGAEAALAAMDPQHPPAIIISDVHMPGIDGWGFCRLLRSPEYAAFNTVPILVVSATFAGDEPVQIAADLGADDFLAFPAAPERFIEKVQALLLGVRPLNRPRVLILEDSRTVADLLRRDFLAANYRADTVATLREAMDAFSKTDYEVAVIDYGLPDGTGDVLLDRIREERPGCVCIMITGDLRPELSLDWIKRGASAYLCKPFDPRYLLELCARARRERALMRVPKLLEQRTQELRRSEERLASVLETQQELICRFGSDTRLTYANPAFARFFEPSGAGHVGTSFLDLVPEANRGGLQETISMLSAGAKSRTFVHAVEMPGGPPVWVEWTCQALANEEGHVAEYQFVGRDVSDRKRMEEALDRRMLALVRPLDSPEGIEVEDLFNLAELQRLQDEFAEATGVASIITRVDGEPITRPSRFTRLCNLIRSTEAGRANCYRSDSIIGGNCARGFTIQPCLSGGIWDAGAGIKVGGRHIANWLIGQVRDETMGEDSIRAYARQIGADENQLAEAFHEVPAMSRKQFESVARMLATLAAQYSSYAYQNVQQARFISDLKRAEEQMMASTDRLATVMDSMEAIVTIADMPDHELLFLNECGRQLCGDSDHQMAWKNLQGIGDSGEICPDDQLADAEGNPKPPRHWQYQDPASGRWYEVRVNAIAWTDGRLVRMGIANDITDRKQAEVEKAKLEAKLLQAQKLETIGQLAGGVAHDFNNMLGVIIGYTELALSQADPSTPLHAELQEIHKAADRSAGLTRQLLGFARKQTIVPRVLDLNDTIYSMLTMLKHLIGENIVLAWVPDKQVGPLKMDPSQIEQILVNLCVNSRDAISAGGRIAIETSPATLDEAACAGHEGVVPGDYVRLAVTDNGCGMDAEMLTHIFEPFFTTKDLSQGAGLGLPTVYGIVRQNNGFIEVESRPGRGTSVYIYLPRHSAKSRPVPRDRDGMQFEPVHETILLVEDDASLLNMTRNMLERRGYRVLSAGSPSEAIRLAAENPGQVDLLMTDVIMPEMGGKELADKLRSDQPGLKCLFMSGHTDETLTQRGVLGPGAKFIQKPFSMKELVNSVIQAVSDPGEL